MTLNGVIALILCHFTECVYDVVKQLLPRFQNLLVCDHLNMICEIYQRLFGQNKKNQ